MSDKKGSEQGPDKKRPFIREKIARPPLTRGQVLRRVLAYVLIALLGGAAAGVSFAVAGPLTEKYLVPETTEPSIPVTIPTDAEPATTASQPETEETAGSSEEEETTEPIEDIMQSAIEQYQYNVHDFITMYDALREVVQTADKSIVEVHSVQQGVDWFDNPMETSGMYAGAVIASTDRELLILTTDDAVKEADVISVRFSDGSEAGGTIRQTDTVSGMAVISVSREDMEPSDALITALTLGNSYNLKQGDALVAVGAPSGAVHSSAYGFVSYVQRNVQVADGTARLLYADMKGDAAAGTFLVNTAGELIGWVTDEFSGSSSGMVPVMAISEYKMILEKMTNGISIPYVGIHGQEVTQAMREQGVPIGVYVSECIVDSPAYYAGILSGDVITHIGGRDIITMMDYENKMAELTTGTPVTIRVRRQGADEYIELEYQVTIGAR